MTSESRPNSDHLDAAIDTVLQTMTDVDAREGAARARTLARLAEAGAHDSIGRRRSAPWPWILVPASLVVLLWASLWIARPTPTPEPPLTVARAVVSQSPIVAPPAPVPTPLVTTSPRVDAQSMVTRVVRRASPRPQPQPDRLAVYLQAIQQIPQEVWDRVEASGPPVVTALGQPASHPIAPIAIDEIPASTWPEAEPVDTPSGESR